MSRQTEVLKRNIDRMVLRENHDGLGQQDKQLLYRMIKELHQHEYESKPGPS